MLFLASDRQEREDLTHLEPTGGPPSEQEGPSAHGDRPRPFPQPGEDGRGWANDAEWDGAPQAQPSPSVPPEGGSSMRRVLSALALLIGGLLVALGVLAVAVSGHQQGSGAAEAGLFCFFFSVPFLIVGARGSLRRPRKRDLPGSPGPAATTGAPEASETYERPLPFPPRQGPPAARDSVSEEAER